MISSMTILTRLLVFKMEILFNELSLSGQFRNENEFISRGLTTFLSVLKNFETHAALLLKKSDTWSRNVSPASTLYDLITDSRFRKEDEIRRFKSEIAKLTTEPFWDSDSRQSAITTYSKNGCNYKGTSIAEACERDKMLVSFVDSQHSYTPIDILKNGSNVSLTNLTRHGELPEYLWRNESISFDVYIRSKYTKGKLDFSQVDPKIGFCCIKPNEECQYLERFELIESLSWDAIYSHTGLDYKQYHSQLASKYSFPTYKFRVSQKTRCHGYRSDNRFVVIGFESDHKLSDIG